MSVKSPSSSIGDAPFTASSVPKSAENPLAHDDAGLAGEPPVHLGHDRAHLLVAHEDRLDARGIVERVEDASGVTARHAEHELDAGFFEDADDGVGNVDLVWIHGAVGTPRGSSKSPLGSDAR